MSISIQSINTINTINTINKQENLILLDWDDTILPTSWMTKNNLTLDNIIYSNLSEDLSIHQNCCYEFFTEVLKYSNMCHLEAFPLCF
jgi:hypothetical protein